MKFGYVTIVALNSKTVTNKDNTTLSLLYCTVMKTPQFDSLYTAFESTLEDRRAKWHAENDNKPEEAKAEQPVQPEAAPVADKPAEAKPPSEGSTEAPVAPPKSLSVESGDPTSDDHESEEHAPDRDDPEWWLKGLTEEERKQIEPLGEPVIFM